MTAMLAEEDYYGRLRNAYIQRYRAFSIRSRGVDPQHLGDRHIPSWDGGVDDNGRRHKSAWRRLAAFAASRGIDPFLLIEATFHYWHDAHPPQPNAIASDMAVTMAADYNQEFHGATLARYESLRAALGSRISAGVRSGRYKDVTEALWALLAQDRMCPPLLAYCTARCAGLDDLARLFETAAALEYMHAATEYDRILGQYIPADFKDHALFSVRTRLGREKDDGTREDRRGQRGLA